MRKIWIIAVVAALMLPALVFAKTRLPRECRQEIVQLCGLTSDRGKIRKCLRKKSDRSYLHGCRSELMKRMAARNSKPDAARNKQMKAQGGSEYSYGVGSQAKARLLPGKGQTGRSAGGVRPWRRLVNRR